ncbi:hypothetical protein C1645_752060 [Glomus cerebriforme]|uniref:Uncharacterized protein n=1 Tax=Glomus cerebriforme TaxID=658196 RepID=A0A397TMG1_9GLOM|nr:hypothetical protein C1645_752060 [Glomus cerebriforme]
MTENEGDVICACTQSISKKDWQDHQIVCAKRRHICPAYVSFISMNTASNEYSLSLVDSNCPPSLKEISKLKVLQSEKDNRLEWLESNKIPFMIIHTLRKECPTFGNKQELIEHIKNMCPYWKVKCSTMTFMINVWSWWNSENYYSMIRNSHKNIKCSELSRQEYITHSTELALDPISQKIRAIPKIFPYHCKACDRHFPSSGIHICIKETNSLNIDESEILCPGCKSVIRLNHKRKTSREFENTCKNCNDNKIVIGLPYMIPIKHQEKEIVKWGNGIEKRRVKWSLIKNATL